MTIFKLPDLGEGLTEAEIHQWHVKEGEQVKVDQLLVSVETAKAVVEVPSPNQGVIKKLYAKAGDTVDVGAPLVEFIVEGETSPTVKDDAGSVVGNLQHQQTKMSAETITHTASKAQTTASLAAKAQARRTQVDLSQVSGTGHLGYITEADVIHAALGRKPIEKSAPPAGFEPLKSIRKSMAFSMIRSHQDVVPVTISDDASIGKWLSHTDVTVRLLRAILHACHQEKALNAWFDTASLSRKLHEQINLGIAIDTHEGLFVPVMKHLEQGNPTTWRAQLNLFKQQVKERSIPQAELQGATITLSNFGVFAGRYANPIIVPPQVAIIGAGKIHSAVAFESDKMVPDKVLPISLTFDHRAATGGEASRFLGLLIEDLQKIE